MPINLKKYFWFLLLEILLFSFSDAKSKEFNLKEGWFIQSSEKVNTSGEVISSNDFSTTDWFPTTVPSTIMAALVKNNVYKNVFMGTNLQDVHKEQFEKPWWYRTEFIIPETSNMKNVSLEFDGIVYRANVWLNGIKIESSDKMFGVYRRFQFNVTNLIKFNQKNILAVEIIPPEWGEPTIGFVDWNPKPPDNNMGIWREVKIKVTGDVSINFPFVKSKLDLENFKSAELSISLELKNQSNKNISGTLTGEIGSIKFSKEVTLEPNENKLVVFTPEEFAQLKIENPRIWWIHNWGKPELYNLKLLFTIDGKLSDEAGTRFGIREVSDYINEQGHRGYKLNGKKILITGGGWVDQLFLVYDYQNLVSQIQYVKHMGLNTIRLEGIWGNNQDLYNLCDEYGIFLMVGYSCQWEWENYMGKPDDEFGSIKTPEDIELVAASWRDQVKWLRNHPSIFVWVAASDKLPRPELEKKYLEILKFEDQSRPYLSSTHQGESEITGRSAVKMNGPYEYVPPMYWSVDTENGGAFGFNTETGPGPQVPPLESIRKMIPPDHLWPIDNVWDYHCGRNEFNTLTIYNNAMNNRLGKPNNLKDYITKAQYLNYEGMRAMFEAFAANKPVTTGIIQWMLNASWPKLWWQLYDYYLMPNAAFYGTKKALEPLHIQYDYKDNAIVVVNNTLKNHDYLKVKVAILNSDIFISQKFTTEQYVSLKPNESQKLLLLPNPKNIAGLTTTYFLALRLYNNKNDQLSNNFYCLSTKTDILDTEKTDWYITPIKEYADLTGLEKIEKVELHKVTEEIAKHKVNVKYKISDENYRKRIDVELINKSGTIVLQVELALTQGVEGESVLPIFWDDNYFSLLPEETKIITGYFNKEDLGGTDPELQISGWNIKSN